MLADKLLDYMCGSWSNRNQAFSYPAYFARVQLNIARLPHSIEGMPAAAIRQAYVQDEVPYRVAVIGIAEAGDYLYIMNFKFKEPDRYLAWHVEPEVLKNVSSSILDLQTGCNIKVKWDGTKFEGRTDCPRSCEIINKKGHSYLQSNIVCDGKTLKTADKGFDVQTSKQIWGTEHGHYIFDRI